MITGCISNQNSQPKISNFETAVLSTPIPSQPMPTIGLSAPAISATASTPLSDVEGITTTQINVRTQPSTASTALGMLNIFTKVRIISKDASSSWYQIEYADSFGWVSAEYVQVNASAEIPFSVTAEPTAAQVNIQPTESFPSAMLDGDSMQAPLASVFFSPTTARSLQVNNAVSAPTGDTEDWLQFAAYDRYIKIRILCTNSGLRVELWDNAARVDDFSLACGSERFISIISENNYFFRLSEQNAEETRYTSYIAIIENVH